MLLLKEMIIENKIAKLYTDDTNMYISYNNEIIDKVLKVILKVQIY